MYKVRPVKVLEVYLWGRRLGALTLDSPYGTVFQYDPAFVKSGFEIAPFEMPLNGVPYRFADFNLPRGAFSGLPGAFADSLPDSFGNALVRQWMAENGVSDTQLSALDRLAYIGSRGMGALTYEPDFKPYAGPPFALDMRKLTQTARAALNGSLSSLSGPDALREIIRVGTSAGGAQAKAIVAWNPATSTFLAGQDNLPAGFEHWLVKFSPEEDPAQGEREFAVYERAVAAGINMSESRLFELDGVKHFMTRRFDRNRSQRHLVQTYCALRHLPPAAPVRLSTYEGLFDTAIGLGLDYPSLEELFRRMAFNVLINECDDHSKNFSFMRREGGAWELAPAYDLTGVHNSSEWGNFSSRHALSVNGKFSSITDDDLLTVAARFGINTAPKILQQVKL